MLAYLVIALNILAGLVLTPVMVIYWGQAQFGLYQLIGAFVGYLTILDFGVSTTVIRYSAKYLEEGDKEGEENFYAMCAIIYSAIAFLTVCAGGAVYCYLDALFGNSLTAEEFESARVMFLILVASAAFTIFGRAFLGIMQGYECFVYAGMIAALAILLKIVAVITVIACGFGCIAVVCVDATINALLLIAHAACSLFLLKVKFTLHRWDKPLFREVAAFAFWVFLGAVVLQLNFRIGRLILGVMTTTSAVAVYAVAMQINTMYNGLSSAIASVFLPRATQLVVQKAAGQELTQFMVGPSRYQFTLLAGVLGGFLLFGREFITLWVGPEYATSWLIAAIVMVPVTISLIQNLGISVLQAMGKHRFRSLLYFAIAVANAIATVFLVDTFGVVGPAYGTAVALVIGNIIIMNLYYHFRIGLDIPLFFRRTLHRLLPVAVLAGVLGATLLLIPGSSWFLLAFRSTSFLVIYAGLMWLWGLNDAERAFFARFPKRIAARLPYTEWTA